MAIASGAVTWTRLAPDASADAVAVTPGGAGACAGAVAVKPDLATVVNVETSGAAVDAEPPGLVAPAAPPSSSPSPNSLWQSKKSPVSSLSSWTLGSFGACE